MTYSNQYWTDEDHAQAAWEANEHYFETYVPHWRESEDTADGEDNPDGRFLNPADMMAPGDPVFVIAADGRFVCHPGVDGEDRCAR